MAWKFFGSGVGTGSGMIVGRYTSPQPTQIRKQNMRAATRPLHTKLIGTPPLNMQKVSRLCEESTIVIGNQTAGEAGEQVSAVSSQRSAVSFLSGLGSKFGCDLPVLNRSS